MKPKKPFDINKVDIYNLLNLDAYYPDRIKSFADRYMHWRRIDSVIKCFCREIKKTKKQTFDILDVGCGRGYIDFKLKDCVDKNHNLRVVGIDNYKPAIDFADTRKKFLNRDDCHFKLMDTCKLEFKNNFFDIIICSEVLEHLKDPQAAMKEIYRVLKKGGLAIISTPNKREGKLANIAKVILKKLLNYKRTELPGGVKDTFVFSQPEMIRHISVKNHKEWTKIFKRNRFSLQAKIGTGGMLYNYKFFEEHRFLFGLMVIFDTLLENLPFSYLWSEILFFELRK